MIESTSTIQANSYGKVKQNSEYFTSPAEGHLLFPAFLSLALTDRTTDKPAEMPGSKFACRTGSLNLWRTLPYHPTWPLWILSTIEKTAVDVLHGPGYSSGPAQSSVWLSEMRPIIVLIVFPKPSLI